ncbi:MAG TPA: hypothetical protein VKU41_03295 [Polyangiaceae bacterium]|nr:hypothetical protein [Polyangiaceae bacterium]
MSTIETLSQEGTVGTSTRASALATEPDCLGGTTDQVGELTLDRSSQSIDLVALAKWSTRKLDCGPYGNKHERFDSHYGVVEEGFRQDSGPVELLCRTAIAIRLVVGPSASAQIAA